MKAVENKSLEIFERIAKEGRKYGVSLVIVSQRPAELNTTIISQCNNIISLKSQMIEISQQSLLC